MKKSEKQEQLSRILVSFSIPDASASKVIQQSRAGNVEELVSIFRICLPSNCPFDNPPVDRMDSFFLLHIFRKLDDLTRAPLERDSSV
jgi:hypothetical protein